MMNLADLDLSSNDVHIYTECEFCTGLFPVDAIDLHIKVGHEVETSTMDRLVPIRRAFAVTELPGYFEAQAAAAKENQQMDLARDAQTPGCSSPAHQSDDDGGVVMGGFDSDVDDTDDVRQSSSVMPQIDPVDETLEARPRRKRTRQRSAKAQVKAEIRTPSPSDADRMPNLAPEILAPEQKPPKRQRKRKSRKQDAIDAKAACAKVKKEDGPSSPVGSDNELSPRCVPGLRRSGRLNKQMLPSGDDALPNLRSRPKPPSPINYAESESDEEFFPPGSKRAESDSDFEPPAADDFRVTCTNVRLDGTVVTETRVRVYEWNESHVDDGKLRSFVDLEEQCAPFKLPSPSSSLFHESGAKSFPCKYMNTKSSAFILASLATERNAQNRNKYLSQNPLNNIGQLDRSQFCVFEADGKLKQFIDNHHNVDDDDEWVHYPYQKPIIFVFIWTEDEKIAVWRPIRLELANELLATPWTYLISYEHHRSAFRPDLIRTRSLCTTKEAYTKYAQSTTRDQVGNLLVNNNDADWANMWQLAMLTYRWYDRDSGKQIKAVLSTKTDESDTIDNVFESTDLLSEAELKVNFEHDKYAAQATSFPSVSECDTDEHNTVWMPCPALSRNNLAFYLCAALSNPGRYASYLSPHAAQGRPDSDKMYIRDLRIDKDIQDIIGADGGEWLGFMGCSWMRGYTFDTNTDTLMFNTQTRYYGCSVDQRNVVDALDKHWTHLIYQRQDVNKCYPNQLRIRSMVMSRETYINFSNGHAVDGKLPMLFAAATHKWTDVWPFELLLVAYKTYKPGSDTRVARLVVPGNINDNNTADNTLENTDQLTRAQLKAIFEKDDNETQSTSFPPKSECATDAHNIKWLPCTALARNNLAFYLCTALSNSERCAGYISANATTQSPDSNKLYIRRLGKDDNVQELAGVNGAMWSQLTNVWVHGFNYDINTGTLANTGLGGPPANGYRCRLNHRYVHDALDKQWTHLVYQKADVSCQNPNQVRVCAMVMSRDTYNDFAKQHAIDGKLPAFFHPQTCQLEWPFEMLLVAYKTYQLGSVDDQNKPTRVVVPAGTITPSTAKKELISNVIVNDTNIFAPKLNRSGKRRYVRFRSRRWTRFELSELHDPDVRKEAELRGYDNSCNGPFVDLLEVKKVQRQIATQRTLDDPFITDVSECHQPDANTIWIPLTKCNATLAVRYLLFQKNLYMKHIPTQVPTTGSMAYMFDLSNASNEWRASMADTFCDDGGEWYSENKQLLGYNSVDGEAVRVDRIDKLKHDVTKSYTYVLCTYEFKNVSCPNLFKWRFALTTRESYWRQRGTKRAEINDDPDERVLFDQVLVYYNWFGKPRPFKRMPTGMCEYFASKPLPGQKEKQWHFTRLGIKFSNFVHDQLTPNYTSTYQNDLFKRLNAERSKWGIEDWSDEQLRDKIRNAASQVGIEIRAKVGKCLHRPNRKYSCKEQAKVLKKLANDSTTSTPSVTADADDSSILDYDPGLEDEDVWMQDGETTELTDRDVKVALEVRKIDVNGPFVPDAELKVRYRAQMDVPVVPENILRFEDCIVDAKHNIVWLPLQTISLDTAAFYLYKSLTDRALISAEVPKTVPCDRSKGFLFDFRHFAPGELSRKDIFLNDDDGGQVYLYNHAFKRVFYVANNKDGSLHRAKPFIAATLEHTWTHMMSVSSYRMVSCPDLIRHRFQLASRDRANQFAEHSSDPKFEALKTRVSPYEVALVFYEWYGPPRTFTRVKLSARARQCLFQPIDDRPQPPPPQSSCPKIQAKWRKRREKRRNLLSDRQQALAQDKHVKSEGAVNAQTDVQDQDEELGLCI